MIYENVQMVFFSLAKLTSHNTPDITLNNMHRHTPTSHTYTHITVYTSTHTFTHIQTHTHYSLYSTYIHIYTTHTHTHTYIQSYTHTTYYTTHTYTYLERKKERKKETSLFIGIIYKAFGKQL